MTKLPTRVLKLNPKGEILISSNQLLKSDIDLQPYRKHNTHTAIVISKYSWSQS